MNRIASLLILLLIFCLSLSAKISVTQSALGVYNITWDLPSWQLSAEKDFTVITAAGLNVPATAGAPLLPYDECKVAVPEQGSLQFDIIRQNVRSVHLEKRLQPVPHIVYNDHTDAYQYKIDEVLYSDAPKEVLQQLPLQRFRNLTFIPIKINPFLYDGKNDVQVISHMEVMVTVSGNLQQKSNLPEDELSALIAKQTVNPTEASQWQSSYREAINFADFTLSDYWVKLETNADGIYKITPAQLSMLPLNDIDPRSFRLFTTGGAVQSNAVNFSGPQFKEVPIYVSGENDGSFNTGDYILFYGSDRDGYEMNQVISGTQYINPYSQNVCYWLTFGGSFSGVPKRITMASPLSDWTESVTTTPATVRIENDVYQRNTIGFEWYMAKLFGSSTADYSYNITLEDLDTSQSQTLSLLLKQEYLRNGSDLIHKVRLKVNNNWLLNSAGNVQEWSWTSLSPINITHTGKYFIPGNNNIVFHVIRSLTDNLFLDFYQVTYQKKLIKRSTQFLVSVASSLNGYNVRYNFTGNNTNLRVFQTSIDNGFFAVTELLVNSGSDGFYFVGNGNASTQYWVVQDTDLYQPVSVQLVTTVDLSRSSVAYDNIIITPSEFVQQANTLASFYRQHFGKNSKVVLQQDIFNQFNAGMPDPNAIRLFLKQAVRNYPAPAVTSVTLLGSGTLDWRNFSGVSSAKNKIIVFQKSTSTTDDYFGMLNTEQYPELVIGRYPAKSVSELNIMLSNLNRYVTQPTGGIWRDKLVFIADDEFNGSTVGEYSHSQQLEATSQMINRSILIDKIFAIDYEFDEFQNKPEVRDAMMAEINSGTLIWYYIGHGAFDTLGAEDYFNGSLDMGRFDNTGKLPLFIAASCDIAEFDNYAFDCLAEKVVLVDNSACIASIAATRECNGPSNVALLQKYYDYALNLRNPIGYSLLQAKIAYTEYNGNDEKYNILGDPLLLVTTPERDSTMAVVAEAGKEVTFRSRQTVNLNGEFSADNLNTSALLQVFDSDIRKTMPNNSPYTFRGRTVYNGSSTVVDSHYNFSFIVPDDITNGYTGLVLAYVWDEERQKDFVNYMSPVFWSNNAVTVNNTDAPQIKLYLNDLNFVPYAVVNSSPLLIAAISDSNGINITNSPGHGILLILDQTASINNVTNYFSYNPDSHTEGTLRYRLSGLNTGEHLLQLIAFDNFNRPSVASVNFSVGKSKSFTVEDFLPYPNPMKKSGWFTFKVSEPADVKISIYTIKGKKIKTITVTAAKGFNQIPWDGKDADGDYLANNTYFIKITAKALSGNGKAEKTEKLVIYH